MELHVISRKISLVFILILPLPLPFTAYSASRGAAIDNSNVPQKNTWRLQPDLGCILFDDAGCQISCNVLCDMYGCQSEAKCVHEIYCDCNEIYEISSSPATFADYKKLSFNKLWNYKIYKSKYADKVRQKIIQDPETFEIILSLLRNPHKTGIDVKKRLTEMNPNWPRVRKLQPKRLGFINDLINDVRGFDDDGFEEYLETNMEPLVDKMHDKLQKVEYELRLATVLDNTDEEEEIRQIVKQIMLSKKDSLYDYASNFLQKKGLEMDNLALEDVSSITVDDTDQIILAGVLQKLIDVEENRRNFYGKTFAPDDEMVTDDDDSRNPGCSSIDNDGQTFILSDETTTTNEDLYDPDFDTDDDDRTVFTLSDEMATSNDDLYDPDFDTNDDDGTEFTLSDEMATTRDDLYDPDFDRLTQSVTPKKRKRETNRDKRVAKKFTRNAITTNRRVAYNDNQYDDNIPYSSRSDSVAYDDIRGSRNGDWWSDGYLGKSIQSWNLGNSGITLENGPQGNTRMQWKLGKSSITLTDDGRGNAAQSWNLGSSGVYLQ